MRRFKPVAFRCEEPLYDEIANAAGSVNLSIAKFLLAMIKAGLAVFKQGGLPALKRLEEQ